MTTIVYRDGVMAADRKAYGGNWNASPGLKTKIRKVKGKKLVAGCSSSVVGGPECIMKWLEDGVTPDDKPDNFELLVVNPKGQAFLGKDALHLSGPIEGEFFAVGSGDKYALGAMAMGADAETAVRIASMFDPHTGSETTAIRVKP